MGRPDMGQDELELGDSVGGGWGSGLLWPVARIAAIVGLVAVVAHWALSSSGGAPAAEVNAVESDRAVAPTAAPANTARASDDEGSREYAVHADRNGRFFVEAIVNGTNVRFLIDTGATNLALSKEDADKLGLNASQLEYSQRFQTANGIALGAPTRLRELRVGAFGIHDVPATVMASSMPFSLLGMSVLSRFASHEVIGDKLVLRW